MSVAEHKERVPRATYQDIARFLAGVINATRFDSGDASAITGHVRVRTAAVTETDSRVVRVDLSDGSFFFLDPEYFVPRGGV